MRHARLGFGRRVFPIAAVLLGACACGPEGGNADCGNGTLDGDEQCDEGPANGVVCTPPAGGDCRYCDAACRWATLEAPPACPEGAVTERCDCGGATVDEGYCCAGVPQAEPCASCEDGIRNQGEEGIDCGGPCRACDPPADYYVSAEGNDAADGRSPETAWRTLDKVDAELANVEPGQRIAFRRRDAFHGTLHVTRSGTAGSPITFGAYGAGPRPVITGFTRVTGWTAEGGGVQSAVVAGESPPEVVVVDGVPYGPGRWPNEGEWAHYESHVGRDSITDDELAASPDWTGAELVLRANEWAIVRNAVTGHAGSTIAFASALPESAEYDLKDGWGYFVQHSRAALDAFGESYYDSATATLYLYFGAEDPEAHAVDVATLDTLAAFASGTDHVTFEELAFAGALEQGLEIGGNDFVTIRDCEIAFPGNYGIRVDGSTSCSIRAVEIADANDKGIFASYGAHDLHVDGCTIRDTGTLAGVGLTSTQAHIGIYAARGDNTVLENNRILNTGYSAINHGNTNGIVRNNFIDTYCSMMVDGGGIYYGGQTAAGNMTVEGNIVLHGVGAPGGLPPDRPLSAANGIYVDYNTLHGVAIRGNTVKHCVGGGIFIHESQNIEISDNTVLDCRQAMRFQDSGLGVGIRGITMTGNVFAGRTADQPTLWARTSDVSNDFELWGGFDDNHYVRPIDDDRTITAVADGWDSAPLSLPEWRALSGQDAGSQTSPLTFPPHVVEATLGANLFANGGFDAGIDGVACWNDAGNCAPSHDASHLDGGALAVTFDARVPTGNSLLTLGVGPVSSERTYALRFSSLARAEGSAYRVYLRKRGEPWTVLSEVDDAPIAVARLEREVVFAEPLDEADAVIVFSIGAADSTNNTLWFDNVELHEAAVRYTDPDDHLRLEYNATDADRVVPLDDTWFDVHGTAHSGTLTLAPFTSMLLMRE
ncbi:MAG: right-handed parallel beta-helix repeat-containing protein [Deltaproteobacteria bacterium]|nr:right-handed parallel beta-helix repeat-containing protein [Deltaproteobacteria bacterium]